MSNLRYYFAALLFSNSLIISGNSAATRPTFPPSRRGASESVKLIGAELFESVGHWWGCYGRTAQGFLRTYGRGERRSQGVYRGVLS